MARGIPNPERDARALELHNQGLDQTTIAERLGLSDSGVGSILKRLGVRSKTGPKPKWTPENLEIAKQKWISGLSASEIGLLLGVSKNAVIGALNRLGVERPAAVIEANRRKGGNRKPDGSQKRPKSVKPPAPRLGKVASLIQPAPFRVSSLGAVYVMPETRKLPKYTGLAPGSKPKPWIERLSGECSWPAIGEGADLLSCCAPVSPGTSWCNEHNHAGRQGWSGKGYHTTPERYVADVVRRCA